MVGETFTSSRTPQRMAAMRALGCTVTTIATVPEGQGYETRPSLLTRLRHRLRVQGDPAGANRALLRAVADGADLVWLDNAPMIRPSTLLAARRLAPGLRLAWYCEDDMMNPRLGSRWLDRAMPLFDLWVTTKSYNIHPDELPARGVRRMLFVNNCYDPELHRPLHIDDCERHAFGCAVSFIGTYERQRAQSLVHLARSGVPVRIWGNGWDQVGASIPGMTIEGRPVYNDDFRRVIAASAVNLCFLRKVNRDLQTCRSVEIPACGGFMLHERNGEIAGLFREDLESGYFGDDGELVSACRRWLADDAGRARVAAAARERCGVLRLDHAAMLLRALEQLGLTP